ncbi:hypothetical protein GCM10027160_46740 [Streptomyces calidiresistens]
MAGSPPPRREPEVRLPREVSVSVFRSVLFSVLVSLMVPLLVPDRDRAEAAPVAGLRDRYGGPQRLR